MKYDQIQIPDPKLLPHMIADSEVPVLMHADEQAENSIRRRLDKKIEKEERSRTTKFILGTAAVAAAFVALGKETVDFNRQHAQPPAPVEQTHNGYVNSGIDSAGHVISFSDSAKQP